MTYSVPSSAKMYAFLRRLKENCFNQVIKIASDEVKRLGRGLVDLRGARTYISFFFKYIKILYDSLHQSARTLTDPPKGILGVTYWN